jgi:hypothetical protein
MRYIIYSITLRRKHITFTTNQRKKMKILRISLTVLALFTSFSAFSEDWDAMGNPTNPPVERPDTDTSGDWDAMGNPR